MVSEGYPINFKSAYLSELKLDAYWLLDALFILKDVYDESSKYEEDNDKWIIGGYTAATGIISNVSSAMAYCIVKLLQN